MGSSTSASEDAGVALLAGLALLAGVTLSEDFAESLTGAAELDGVFASLEIAELLLAGVLDPLDFAAGASDEEDSISSGVSMVIPWCYPFFRWYLKQNRRNRTKTRKGLRSGISLKCRKIAYTLPKKISLKRCSFFSKVVNDSRTYKKKLWCGMAYCNRKLKEKLAVAK